MLITIPNADFSGAGLGTVTLMRHGMPAAGLVGLYLFDETTIANGAAYGGTVKDYSGLGNDATLFPEYGTPVKSADGVTFADRYGAMWQTPIPYSGGTGRKQTVIWAGRDDAPGSLAGVFLTMLAPSTSLGLDDGSKADGAEPYPSYSVNTDHNASVPSVGTIYKGYDISTNTSHAVWTPSTVTLSPTGAAMPAVGVPRIWAMAVDGAAGRMSLRGHWGGAVELLGDTAIQSWIDGSRAVGNVAFGMTQHQTAASTSPLGAMYAAAIYDRAMSNAEMDNAIQYMRAIVAARGVTGW